MSASASATRRAISGLAIRRILEAVADIGRHAHVRNNAITLEHDADLASIRGTCVDPLPSMAILTAVRRQEAANEIEQRVLPQPDGPSNVISSPRRINSDTSSSAVDLAKLLSLRRARPRYPSPPSWPLSSRPERKSVPFSGTAQRFSTLRGREKNVGQRQQRRGDTM